MSVPKAFFAEIIRPAVPPQLAVVLQFQAAQALPVATCKAQNGGGHCTVGIVPLIVVDQAYAVVDIIFLQKGVTSSFTSDSTRRLR